MNLAIKDKLEQIPKSMKYGGQYYTLVLFNG